MNTNQQEKIVASKDDEAVSVERMLAAAGYEVVAGYENVKNMIKNIITKLPEERDCFCKEALKDVFI